MLIALIFCLARASEIYILTPFITQAGDRRSTVLQNGRSLVRSQLVSLEFFVDIKSFRSHYGPGVDSASNRNEYQEHFLGVKAAGAYG